jgi:hypothetical protein
MPRFVPIAAAVLSTALVTMPTVKSGELQRPAEFISGSVTSIPAGTAGTLDTSSHTELQFRYRGSVFSVPYQKITNTETAGVGSKHLWKVPVPMIGKSARFLTIAYRTADDSAATVTFKAPAPIVSSLVSTIDERKAPEVEPAPLKTREAAKLAEEQWWGNRYWRTLNNKSKWPQPADSQGAPSGTAAPTGAAPSGGTKE